MSDTNSHKSFDDELLSAHIDGELTEAERAAVEQRLRDDPQARELVAELRAVSETLRSLPKHELGADLREAVLVHAERAPAEGGRTRRWAWAALALAAALLLTVYLPEANHDEQPLAQALPKAGAPLKEREVEQPVLQFQVETYQVADADSSALGAVIDGILRSAPVQAPQIQPIGELPAEDYHVHLKPADRRVGTAQFDQLLVSNGIVVRSDNSNELGADEPGSNTSGEAELVLVEASLEQIQQIVASCSGDDSPWKSLRLVDQDGDSSSLLFFADQKPKAAAIRAARGWARYLGRGPLALGQSMSTEAKFLRMRNLATSERRAADQRIDIEQQPMTTIRVLFILHPAGPSAGE